STSVMLTGIFVLTGWFLQRSVMQTATRSLEEEVQASFRAYESLWQSRAEMLRTVAAMLSHTPDIPPGNPMRAASILRSSAEELWDKLSDNLKQTGFFLITDPDGNVVSSIETASGPTPASWPVDRSVARRFPNQASGFYIYDGELYQVVL